MMAVRKDGDEYPWPQSAKGQAIRVGAAGKVRPPPTLGVVGNRLIIQTAWRLEANFPS